MRDLYHESFAQAHSFLILSIFYWSFANSNSIFLFVVRCFSCKRWRQINGTSPSLKKLHVIISVCLFIDITDFHEVCLIIAFFSFSLPFLQTVFDGPTDLLQHFHCNNEF